MSKRILVVEDQPDNRQIIRDMLAPTDYEITEAENGEEALTAIAKQRPDLILMGIQLPIMDGYESRAKSRPIPRCDRFRSSPSPPTRWMGKNRQRERQDVMAMCRSLTVLATYWRKFSSACPNRCDRLLHCMSPLYRDRSHFGGRTSLSGHNGHGWSGGRLDPDANAE